MYFMSYRLSKYNKTQRNLPYYRKNFWDKDKKISKSKHYKSLGYLHDLQKQFPDPIAHCFNSFLENRPGVPKL